MVTSLGGRWMTLHGNRLAAGHLRDMTFAATQAGLPGAACVFAGARQGGDGELMAAGFEYQLTPNAVLGGRFDGCASAKSRSYAGSASMRISF
ncbi:hypothetical protein [Bosea sp. (in: a-proteobacteria)]|uniref:hypothetical protein n=1 Tax=Bosea sp. (in: a-proteobacteria) TaxID=1871050 RepID=UPI003F722B7E